MPIREWGKPVGKYIAVFLCIGVVFFLLLPLLDDTASVAPVRKNSSKTIPQIFSSNPLTNLVNKVYAILTRSNKRMPSLLESLPVDEYLAEQIAEQEAPANRASIENLEEIGNQLALPSNASVQAVLVDDEGSWILVRQTSPASSQRGLHEINVHDSAYDRLLRMERQAKYAGGQQTAEIPQSKWARFWQPIKEVLGLETSSPKVVSAKPFGARGKSAPLDMSNARKDPVQYTKPNVFDDWQASGSAAAGSAYASLLNPRQRLFETSKRLKDSAREFLSSQAADKMIDLIDQATQNAQNWLEEQLLQQDEGQTPVPPTEEPKPTVEKPILETITYKEPASSSVYRADLQAAENFQITPWSSEAEQAIQKTQEQNRQLLLAAQGKLTGQVDPNETFPILTVYGVTGDGQSPTEKPLPLPPGLDSKDVQKIQAYQGIVQAMEDKKCANNPCVWVGLDPQALTDVTAPNRINSSGASATGIKGQELYSLVNEIVTENIQNATTNEEADRWVDIANMDLHKLTPNAIPMLQSEFVEQYKDGNVMILTTNEAQRRQLSDKGISAARTMSDNGLLQQNDQSDEQAGTKLREQITQLWNQSNNLANQAEEQVVNAIVPELMSSSLQETAANINASDLW